MLPRDNAGEEMSFVMHRRTIVEISFESLHPARGTTNTLFPFFKLAAQQKLKLEAVLLSSMS